MPTTGMPKSHTRHLVLIDIENLAATPSPTSEDVEAVKDALGWAVPDFDTAQCVVACSHHAAPAVAFGFRGARHLWRSGPDGADLALLQVLHHEGVEKRFSRVTICSGDGIFAAIAARLAGSLVEVNVVSLEDCLAVRLELAAMSVVKLTRPTRFVSLGSAS